MTSKRRQHPVAFKFRVALESVREHKTIGQIASEYQVHPTQVREWKKKLMEGGPAVFRQHTTRQQREQEERETALYEQIGRLKMELEWLKKKAAQFS